MRAYVRERRGGGWFWLHNYVIDHYAARLGPYALAVYLNLCRHVGEEQATWVGQRTIAKEMGVSERQVRRELGKLEEAGLIAVEERVEPDGQKTNIYTLLDAAPPVSQSGGAASQSGAPGQPVRGDGPTPINRTRPMGTSTPAAEPSPDGPLAAAWAVALADLREQIPPANVARWLGRAALVSAEDGTAVLACPDQATAEQLAARYDALVRRAVGDALGRPVAVEYRADGDR